MTQLQPLSPPASQAAAPNGSPQPVSWTRDEFDLLAVRTANEPERVRAAVSLYTARLVNLPMLKDMLDIKP